MRLKGMCEAWALGEGAIFKRLQIMLTFSARVKEKHLSQWQQQQQWFNFNWKLA